jgi:hypothetical protein
MNQEETKKDIIGDFFLARKKFVMELIFWCGVVLITGFVRVNMFDADLEVNTPQYITYNVLGNEVRREIDVDAMVDMNTGRKIQKK